MLPKDSSPRPHTPVMPVRQRKKQKNDHRSSQTHSIPNTAHKTRKPSTTFHSDFVDYRSDCNPIFTTSSPKGNDFSEYSDEELCYD